MRQNFKYEVFEKNVLANNNILTKKNEKGIAIKNARPYEVMDNETGEVKYTLNYYPENWTIVKTKSRFGISYNLELSLVSKSNKAIKISFYLTEDEVEYINSIRDNVLSKMAVGSAIKFSVLTRFVFGLNSSNNFFIKAIISIGDGVIRKNDFLAQTKLEIIGDVFCTSGNSFPIVLDKSLSSNVDENTDIDLL